MDKKFSGGGQAPEFLAHVAQSWLSSFELSHLATRSQGSPHN